MKARRTPKRPQNRPASSPNSTAAPETSPEDTDEEIELPNSIQAFLASAQRAGNDVAVILYRRDAKPGSGRPKRLFLEEYQNEAPSMKEIALNFGGGAYEIQIISNGSDDENPHLFKSIQFNIDSKYDQKTRENSAPALLPAFNPQEAFQQSLSMITGMVSAIAPLFANRPTDSNPAALLSGFAEIGNKMLMSSFQNQIESQKYIMETLRENQSNTGSDEEQDGTFNKILQTLEMVLPMFLNSPAAMQNKMIQQAAAAPEIQKVLNSQQKTEALRTKLINKFGAEKTEQILKMFLKKRAEKPAAAPKTQPEPKKATA